MDSFIAQLGCRARLIVRQVSTATSNTERGTQLTTEIDWKTDGSGLVLGANIHDGLLEGISYHSAQRLSFNIRSTGGDVFSFVAEGIAHLNIVELWEAMIVGELFAWRLGAVPTYSFGQAARTLFKGRYSEEQTQRLRESMPDALLVEVTSSYGGSIFLICDRLKAYRQA